MRILIVGGSSSLAQVLRPALSAFAEVLTAGRSGCDVELDLTWPAERFRIPTGVDVVVNTAAHFGGSDFEAILAAETVNALGGVKLSHAAVEAGAGHFVSISSTSAYLDSHSEYYGIYALSKRHADEVVQLYCARENLPCTVLRPSQLYGDLDSFGRHQPFLYNALDKVMRNEDIVIYGGRDALRNYIHVEDFCRTIAAVIEGRIEGVYSCTSREDTSLVEVANTVITAAGSRGKVVFNGAMKDIPDNVFPYDDTLYRRIGGYPAIGIKDGIARLVASRLVKP
jgi:UDP-glucose 4-epimerase